MRTSVYRFLKKGSRELVRALLDAGFDGDQRNGTGHIKFTHPITKIMNDDYCPNKLEPELDIAEEDTRTN